MKRPVIVSVFASLLFIEALYELVLFPLSLRDETFRQLAENLPISIEMMRPFGFAKGLYALFGGVGLLLGLKWIRWYLWILTPLFPIASFLLTQSFSLAPFGFAFAFVYVVYLRRSEVQQWFLSDKKLILPINQSDISDKIDSSPKPVANTFRQRKWYKTLSLFIGGYFLINVFIGISVLKSPVELASIAILIVQMLVAVILSAVSVQFGKDADWKKRIGSQLIVCGGILLFYALLLKSISGSAEFDMINVLFDGIFNDQTGNQILFNSLVILGTGIYFKFRHTQEVQKN